jgi:hypothetical protein
VLFSNDDIDADLRARVAELVSVGAESTILVVGGAAVALVVGDVGDGDASPGQRAELGWQPGLVGFDGQQVVRAAPVQVVGE